MSLPRCSTTPSPTILIAHESVGPIDISRIVRLLRLTVGEGRESDASFELLVQASPDVPIDVPVALDDLFLLPHTSGTSGRPKGVMLSHAT